MGPPGVGVARGAAGSETADGHRRSRGLRHPLRTLDVGHDQELGLVEVGGTRNEEHCGHHTSAATGTQHESTMRSMRSGRAVEPNPELRAVLDLGEVGRAPPGETAFK
jgi:hypothetical protein